MLLLLLPPSTACSHFILLSNKQITQNANLMYPKTISKVLKNKTIFFLVGFGVFLVAWLVSLLISFFETYLHNV